GSDALGGAAEDDGRRRVLPGKEGGAAQVEHEQVGPLPRCERPDLRVEAECARGPEGSKLQGVLGRQRRGVALARAGEEQRGAELLEQVERGRRGGAVRAEAD